MSFLRQGIQYRSASLIVLCLTDVEILYYRKIKQGRFFDSLISYNNKHLINKSQKGVALTNSLS